MLKGKTDSLFTLNHRRRRSRGNYGVSKTKFTLLVYLLVPLFPKEKNRGKEKFKTTRKPGSMAWSEIMAENEVIIPLCHSTS